MNCTDYLGWAIVIAIWAAIVWLLANVLSFTGPDYDPDERDPYD